MMSATSDPMPLSKIVEELRAARRQADETLRDTQEAADRALDAMDDRMERRLVDPARQLKTGDS
jgi:hypothetical protein